VSPHPAPVVLVDGNVDVHASVTTALQRLGGWWPLVILNSGSDAQAFLDDAVRAGRLPAVALIGTQSDHLDDPGLRLLNWILTQNDLVRSMRVVLIGDSTLPSTFRVSAWIRIYPADAISIENVLRAVLRTETIGLP
jgi:hypothetical protein